MVRDRWQDIYRLSSLNIILINTTGNQQAFCSVFVAIWKIQGELYFYTSILFFKKSINKDNKLTLIVYKINIIHINLKKYIPRRYRRKLNVHKTFWRRPRPLQNVLCTFNLLPVSTGYICFLKINDDECRNYEAYIFPLFHETVKNSGNSDVHLPLTWETKSSIASSNPKCVMNSNFRLYFWPSS